MVDTIRLFHHAAGRSGRTLTYERQRGNLNLPACNKNRARDRRQDRCEIESLLGCESSPKDLQYPIHRGIRRIIGDEVHTVP